MIGDRQQCLGTRIVDLLEAALELMHPLTLLGHLGADMLIGIHQRVDERLIEVIGHLRQQVFGHRHLLIGRDPHPQTELGIVLEQGVGPGRSPALLVHRPGGGRQVAAVDGGAAGGVGHQQARAEQLGQQAYIRGLATTGTGAGELEQRLQVLGTAHRGEVNRGATVNRDSFKELDVLLATIRGSVPYQPC